MLFRSEVGAGLQLSPNATRILDMLGVTPLLKPAAVEPAAVVLRDGASFAELARIPLGAFARKRWGSSYLVAHRADLQSALLARVGREADISLTLDAPVRDAALHARGVTVSVDIAGRPQEIACRLLVGADGVRSSLRRLCGPPEAPSFSGDIAWRTTVAADSPAGRPFAMRLPREVTACLRPGFHLIAYPLRAGRAINFVAFTGASAPDGVHPPSDATLRRELARCAQPLRQLLQSAPDWRSWPMYRVGSHARWIAPQGVALIGDAAHAMTPYAAQGAAMAIEDAAMLADAIDGSDGDLPGRLSGWERARRERVEKVRRRAAFNRFAWHAAGPVAMARNLMLKLRGDESLAADMDWLYGWRMNSQQ